MALRGSMRNPIQMSASTMLFRSVSLLRLQSCLGLVPEYIRRGAILPGVPFPSPTTLRQRPPCGGLGGWVRLGFWPYLAHLTARHTRLRVVKVPIK
jgi:hypothetical protein